MVYKILVIKAAAILRTFVAYGQATTVRKLLAPHCIILATEDVSGGVLRVGALRFPSLT